MVQRFCRYFPQVVVREVSIRNTGNIYIINPVSAGTVFIHQILMSVDVRF